MAVHRMWRMKRHLPKAAEEITGKRAKDLESNLKMLKSTFAESSDIAYRNLFNRARMTVIFGDGLVEGEKLYRDLMEPLIWGSKFGFIERITPPLSLIRRHIKSLKLASKTQKIEGITQTDVAVVYLKGVAQDSIAQEALKCLSDIDTDSLLVLKQVKEQMSAPPGQPDQKQRGKA